MDENIETAAGRENDSEQVVFLAPELIQAAQQRKERLDALREAAESGDRSALLELGVYALGEFAGWLTRRGSGWIRRSPNAGRCRCLSTGRRSDIPGSSLLLSAAARCFSLLSRGSGGRGVHGRPDIIGGRLRIGRP